MPETGIQDILQRCIDLYPEWTATDNAIAPTTVRNYETWFINKFMTRET